MKKPELILLLLKCSLCLPGTVNISAKWYKSPYTVISIAGIILTVGNGLYALIHCPSFPPNPRSGKNLTAIPTGTIPTAKSKSISPAQVCFAGDPPHPFPVSANDSDTVPFDRDPGVIVEIAVAGYQLLLFVSNVLLRFLVFASFCRLRDVFHELTTSGETKRKGWIQAAQHWTAHEKVFMALMVASLIEKEIDPITHIIHSLSTSCILQWPSFILELCRSQFQALFSLDLVSESLTFALMGFIASFVYLFDEESCERGLSKEEINLKETVSQVNSLEKLFVLNAPQNRIGGSTLDGIKFAVSSGWNKKISFDPHISPEVPGKLQSESPQEKFAHKVDFYFDTVKIWRRCEFASGSLALVIFLELTTTFCLNTFIGIAAASATGAFNPRTLCSFCRAVIIIGKMICLATLAQNLPDSMSNYARRVLKVYWNSTDSEYTGSSHGKEKTNQQSSHEPKYMEDTLTNDRSLTDYNLSQIVAYIENNPLELSALGYFTISTSTLTSVFGVIITYLVVLIQFHLQILQSETSDSKKQN